MAAGSLACTHVVLRPAKCPPSPPPFGNSGIAWERAEGLGVIGKVVAPGTFMPIQGATVIFTPLSDLTGAAPGRRFGAHTDDAGQFRIDSLPPGTYITLIRRIGYRAASDSVYAAPDSGVIMTGVLARDMISLNECGLMFQEVRVPWWKW
jgi:carboxypeptidase family protein